MKKFLSCLLLLAMFLSLSLTGAWGGRALADEPADQSSTEEAVGVWIGFVDMKPFLEAEDPDLAKNMGAVFASVALELRVDGTYSLQMDTSALIPAFRVAMIGYIEDYCAENGLTIEAFEEISGATVSEVIEEAIAEMEKGDLVTEEEGTYVQEGSNIIFDGSDTCTFTGDMLLIDLDDYGTVELTRAGVVGLWSASVRLGDLEGSEELPEVLQNVIFNRILELRSDNSFFLSLDQESFFLSYRNAIRVAMLESLEENGVSAADVESVYGLTVEELVDQIIAETDLSPLEQVLSGTYTEKDGELSGTADDGTKLQGSWSRNTLSLEIENYGTLNFIHLSTEDVLAKGEGAMTYAEYAAAEMDTEVVIEAYVQAHQDWWQDKVTVYARDAEGAYFLYDMACSEEDAKLLVPGQKIRVTGVKSEWSGEIEIVDASFQIVRGSYLFGPVDVTELLGQQELIEYQNQLVSFRGMTVEAYDDTGAAFAYKDPDGKTDDLYFKASKDGKTYDFCVEFYLCGKDTEVYKAVEALQVGDTVDLEGFLYWYNGANPHVTAVIVK